MDSAGPGLQERASPDRGWWKRSQRNLANLAYLREDATRPAARKGARAANELEGAMRWRQRQNATTSGLAEPKAPAGKKERSSRRRRGARTAEPSTARYFLIKASGSDGLELGQEVASENEAMVESFRVERQLRSGYGVEGQRRSARRAHPSSRRRQSNPRRK